MIRVFRIVVLVVGLPLAQWSMGCVTHREVLKFDYRIPSTVSLHEPVPLEVTIENNSSRVKTIDLGSTWMSAFEIMQRRPDGSTVKLSSWGATKQQLTALAKISLSAGQRQRWRAILNEWLDFNELGSYQVTVTLMRTPTADENAGERPPVTFRLDVTPRDEQKLEAVCQRLLNRIRFSPSIADSIEATTELSFVQDPIAIPYLVTAIEVKRTLGVDQRAIAGLGRIASTESVEALKRLQRSPRSDAAKLASDVLSGMR